MQQVVDSAGGPRSSGGSPGQGLPARATVLGSHSGPNDSPNRTAAPFLATGPLILMKGVQ
jgi:hypothetical protein